MTRRIHPRPRRRALLLALHAAAALPTLDALADAPRARLSWERASGAESCPDEVALASAIEERLGRMVFSSPADLTLEGSIAPAATGWRAVLTLKGRGGETLGVRELVSPAPACDELGASVVLAAALMLDFTEPPPAPPAPPPPPAPPRRIQARVGATGLVATGLMPGLGVGGGVDLYGRYGAWPALLLDGAAWTRETHRAAGAGAELWGQSIGLAVCPLILAGTRLEAGLCAGVTGRRLRARGVDLDASRDVTRLDLGAGARALLSVRVAGPVRITATLGVEAPFRRDRFSYSDATAGNQAAPQVREVHRLSPVVGIAGLGLSVAIR